MSDFESVCLVLSIMLNMASLTLAWLSNQQSHKNETVTADIDRRIKILLEQEFYPKNSHPKPLEPFFQKSSNYHM